MKAVMKSLWRFMYPMRAQADSCIRLAVPHFFLLFCKVRIEFFHAFRTDPVTEFGLGMVANINLDLIPVPLIIPYFFTGAANRQYAA